MAVRFSVVPKKNPSKSSEPAKFYAQAQGHGDMDFDEICKDVDSRCTATPADVAAVLKALLTTMETSLGKSEIIRLGDFGSFQIAVSSTGTVTKEEFNSSLIKKARISFRPGKLLTKMLKTLDYTQVPKLPVKVTNGGNEVG
nr:HU family DNA-binding protein [uncultured Bacteroides sp.]